MSLNLNLMRENIDVFILHRLCPEKTKQYAKGQQWERAE